MIFSEKLLKIGAITTRTLKIYARTFKLIGPASFWGVSIAVFDKVNDGSKQQTIHFRQWEIRVEMNILPVFVHLLLKNQLSYAN